MRWLLIVALAAPALAGAQERTISASGDGLPSPGSRVRVEAAGILAGHQTATILRRSADTLTLAIKGDDPVAVPLSRISSLETSLGVSRRRGMVRGAIIVGAFGVALHVLDGKFGSDVCTSITTCPPGESAINRRVTTHGIIRGAAIGGAFGVFFGYFWPIESWRPVPLPQR